MSTILNSLSRTSGLGRAGAAKPAFANAQRAPSRAGVRGLTVMLLAAAVSALVMLADQYVGAWTDEHLLFGWVMLWAVVFASLALFANTARALANRMLSVLDGWSHSVAQARAEARMWEIAKSDPRVMAEINVARSRVADAPANDSFDEALAPMGFEAQVAPAQDAGWGRFPERLMASRAHRMHLYYI